QEALRRRCRNGLLASPDAQGADECPRGITSCGTVAVLVNLETTPVQLHAKPFASGDPTGRGNSSYLMPVDTLASVVASTPYTGVLAMITTFWLPNGASEPGNTSRSCRPELRRAP